MTPRRAAVVAIAYVAAIVAANVLTDALGFVSVGFGLTATAGTYAAGAALLSRDVLQDVAGRRAVLAAIVTGAALSWWLSTPALAVASGVAFLVAELADFLALGHLPPVVRVQTAQGHRHPQVRALPAPPRPRPRRSRRQVTPHLRAHRHPRDSSRRNRTHPKRHPHNRTGGEHR